MVCFTVGFKHDVHLQRHRLLASASGHEGLLDLAGLPVLLDALCNQAVRHGSHLHRLHTAEFAGSPLDTRNSGPFLQLCKRRVFAIVGKHLWASVRAHGYCRFDATVS
jgi:hypothetical protein